MDICCICLREKLSIECPRLRGSTFTRMPMRDVDEYLRRMYFFFRLKTRGEQQTTCLQAIWKNNTHQDWIQKYQKCCPLIDWSHIMPPIIIKIILQMPHHYFLTIYTTSLLSLPTIHGAHLIVFPGWLGHKFDQCQQLSAFFLRTRPRVLEPNNFTDSHHRCSHRWSSASRWNRSRGGTMVGEWRIWD